MPEQAIEPQDEFYQLRNGVFNLVVALFQEEEKTRGRTWAKKDISSYLHALAEEISNMDETTDKDENA